MKSFLLGTIIFTIYLKIKYFLIINPVRFVQGSLDYIRSTHTCTPRSPYQYIVARRKGQGKKSMANKTGGGGGGGDTSKPSRSNMASFSFKHCCQYKACLACLQAMWTHQSLAFSFAIKTI